MIPVFQDKPDNCFQACLASMFEIALSEVPHFVADAATQEEQGILPAFREWCSRRGVFPIDIPMQGLSLSSVLENVQHLVPDAHYILSGGTVTGTQHAVVCCGGTIVHDPEPVANIARYLEELGLPSQSHCMANSLPEGGMWIVTFFGCSSLAYGKAAARAPQSCPDLRGRRYDEASRAWPWREIDRKAHFLPVESI